MNYTPRHSLQHRPAWLFFGHHPAFFQALDNIGGNIARHDLRLGSLAATGIQRPQRLRRLASSAASRTIVCTRAGSPLASISSSYFSPSLSVAEQETAVISFFAISPVCRQIPLAGL